MMMRRLSVLAAGLMLLALVTPVLAQRPDAPDYAQRGPYPVGTLEIVIPGEEGVPGREADLNATVWYPALNPDEADEVTQYQIGLFVLPGQALRDAAPDVAGGPYPLVIFSHGSGGIRYQSLFLTEHLASHGFVVIAADHPGNTVLDLLFGGGEAAFLDALVRNFGTRPLDVLRQIAYLDAAVAGDGPLAGLVDMARIAVSGHSFGGYTALAAAGGRLDMDALAAWCAEPLDLTPLADVPLPPVDEAEVLSGACFVLQEAETIAAARGLDALPEGQWPTTTDPRIQAAVVMAPYNAPAFGAEGLAAITVPALIMDGSADSVTFPVRDAYPIFRDLGGEDRTLVVFENAEHYLFVDECSAVALRLGQFERCSDPVWDMTRAHDLINHLTTAFLRAQLYGDAAAAAALDAADFTGVVVRQSPTM